MTFPQPLLALARANDVRDARSALRRQLAAAPDRATAWRLAADVIADPPDALASMSVFTLLSRCHRTGPTTIRRLLGLLEIAEDTRLGRRDITQLGWLTTRQRDALVVALGAAPTGTDAA